MSKLSAFLGVLIITLFIVTGCNKKEKSIPDEEDVLEVVAESNEEGNMEKEAIVANSDNSLLNFKIMPLESDMNGYPNSKIYVSSDTKLEFVASIIGKASKIQKSEFNKLNIPQEAITACGAIWEGVGTYYYLADAKKGYVVFKGAQDDTSKELKIIWEAVQEIN